MAKTTSDDVFTHHKANQLFTESSDAPAPIESLDVSAEVTSFIKVRSSNKQVASQKLVASIAELEAQNRTLRDHLRELQFALGTTLIMFINVLLFEKFINSSTALVIFAIFEAGLILLVAKRLGIPELWTIFIRVTSAIAKWSER